MLVFNKAVVCILESMLGYAKELHTKHCLCTRFRFSDISESFQVFKLIQEHESDFP